MENTKILLLLRLVQTIEPFFAFGFFPSGK